eukprot:TRINITY_DN2150_c0_g1_i1.p1 TRINITY_DN2150_c0_g1~~TRINITY_DN2150_c0_g1_i1.p1  ORF type:complete len:314 (+),score=74.13 TRINITY_DN2150_c0_g1_i1:146-1087(+)
MSDEMLMHFSANSNQSDPSSLPTKLAKLEARMAGKGSPSTWQQSVTSSKFGATEELADSSTSSDSDDDIGGEFLIQANVHKRPRLQEDDDQTTVLRQSEGDGRVRIMETTDVKAGLDNANRRKQGRSRGRSGTSRKCGSRANDQVVSSSTVSPLNGQLESSSQKEIWTKEQNGKDERASLLEEISMLRGKVASLEEDLCKARQEISDHQQLCHQLEKELRDLKEQDQQMKPKRIKVLSDLLISVSKAERQEARVKTRQDSLRLGNVGVIRAGTILSETWEDGQALKDLHAHLRYLLEAKEAVKRHWKSFPSIR